MKRHAGLKNEFYERVRTETVQTPETEKRLRETVVKLKQTVADQNAEILELRQQVARLPLAAAVLTFHRDPPLEVQAGPDNVIVLRMPT